MRTGKIEQLRSRSLAIYENILYQKRCLLGYVMKCSYINVSDLLLRKGKTFGNIPVRIIHPNAFVGFQM